MMDRLLLGGLALTCAVLTGIPAGKAETPRTASMRFETYREGPAEVCGSRCRTWVAASGAITADTARDFEAFARGRNLRGATLVLDSVGGSVIGALNLGRAIRRLDMTTTVGRTTPLASAKGQEARATLSSGASCESMCAFVILAGTRRFVPPEAQVLVHQIWLGDRRDDAIAATYTAEDLMIVQRDIGRVAHYTVEMGGAIDLLDVALRIPPWEPMRSLSYDEIQRMRLSTVDNAFAPVNPAAATVAATAVEASAEVTTVAVRASGISERSWNLIEQGGRPLLARRHPMTAEGEDIGSFDVLFTCGPGPDSYAAMYIDRRRGLDNRAAAEMLKKAAFSVGQRSAMLSPGRNNAFPPTAYQRGESIATGTISANLVKTLAESGSRTLVVSTIRANNAETVIRVGMAGMDKALPQFVAACSKQYSRSAQVELGAGGRQ